MSPEDWSVLDYFKTQHSPTNEGRFIIPLAKKSDIKPLDESRSQAVQRFLSFEQLLRTKDHFREIEAVMDEYIQCGHTEPVPELILKKPPDSVFYLPVHMVQKEFTTTTKVRAVLDVSASHWL